MTIDLPPVDRGAAAAAAARFAGHADPDIAYAVLDLPIGRVVAAASRAGVVRLAYEEINGSVDQILESLAERLSPRILEVPTRLDALRRELDEYFAGARSRFTVAVDLTLARGGFTQRVLGYTAQIPYGRTVSYGQVAEHAGNAAAVRAAGNALGSNPVPILIPCHRVLRTGGGLGGYTGGLERKIAMLELERNGVNRSG